MKERRGPNLTWLYLRYALERNTLIVLVISFIILSIALLFLSNPWIEKGIYLMNYKDIHYNYYKQGFFIISIFNSLIIAMIAITFAINSISFDSLFISFTKRGRICFSKIIAGILILASVIITEGIIFFIIPSIMYDKFKIEMEALRGFGYILILSIIEFLASIFISTLIKSVIVPLSVAFIAISIRLISQSITKAYEIISEIFPILGFTDYEINLEGLLLTPLWVVTLALLYVGAYSTKDLKTNL